MRWYYVYHRYCWFCFGLSLIFFLLHNFSDDDDDDEYDNETTIIRSKIKCFVTFFVILASYSLRLLNICAILAATLRWFTAGGAIRIAVRQLSQTWKLRHYDVITRKL